MNERKNNMFLGTDEEFSKLLTHIQREMNRNNLTDKIISYQGERVHIHKNDNWSWQVNYSNDEE
jgi:hypothetical protein